MLRTRSSPVFALLAVACLPTVVVGGTITEIISRSDTLRNADSIAADKAGNAYVSGAFSHNAFKITPDGVISELIDSTGDGIGNTLDYPTGIAVHDSRNVFVTGYYSHNAFKIEMCDAPNDYPLFEGCITGPEGVADAGCICPDDDADGDVDLHDFARFQCTFAGP